jgi:hypothetical protein
MVLRLHTKIKSKVYHMHGKTLRTTRKEEEKKKICKFDGEVEAE